MVAWRCKIRPESRSKHYHAVSATWPGYGMYTMREREREEKEVSFNLYRELLPPYLYRNKSFPYESLSHYSATTK